MKKLLCVLLLLVTTLFAECSFYGNIELVSLDNSHNISAYNYNPVYREGDTLYVRNIILTNRGNETIVDLTLKVEIKFPSEEVDFFQFPPNVLVIKNLEPNETYISKTSNPYLNRLGVLTFGQLLKETGPYEIKLIFDSQIYQSCGHTVKINGQSSSPDSLVFLTKSLTELESLDEAKSSNYAAWIAVLVSLYVVWLAREDSEKLLKKLDEVAKHITTATDRELAIERELKLTEAINLAKALLSELKANNEIIERLREIKDNKICPERLSVICLDSFLLKNSLTYLKFDQENAQGFFRIRRFFVSNNNHLETMARLTENGWSGKGALSALLTDLNNENNKKGLKSVIKILGERISLMEKNFYSSNSENISSQ